MASLKLVFSAVAGRFEEAIEAKYRPIAEAATAAIKDVAAIIKTQGRADIAAALSPRAANALRVNVYPQRKSSVDAAAYLFSRIPYAGIFETGGTIRGQPFLWLPLPAAPKRIGRQRVTPALYIAKIGKLRLVVRPGRPPLLVADLKLRAASRRAFTRATLHRSAAAADEATVSVPMFVGIPTVQLHQRTHIRRICQQARDRLPGLYFEHLNPEA